MEDYFSQYEAVLDEIEQLKQNRLDCLMSHLAFVMMDDHSIEEEDSNNALGKASFQYAENMLALLCLRVRYGGYLIQAGSRNYADQLPEDIDSIIENAKMALHEYKVTDILLSHVWDLLMAICPEHESLLKSNFKHRYQRKLRWPENKLSSDLFDLFTAAAQAYERLGKRDWFLAVLGTLCQLSKKRNGQSLHRELLARVLGIITDIAPESAVNIVRSNMSYLQHSLDIYTGDCWWFYAHSLLLLDERDEAAVCFKKCYEIRKTIFGENNWLTACAKQQYALVIYCFSKDPDCQAYLLEFVDNIENGFYSGVDTQLRQIAEGNTLYMLLMGQLNDQHFENYGAYLDRYAEICTSYENANEPLIKLRLAWNFRGGYYLSAGEYMLAEESFLKALHTKADGPEIVTDAQIKSNLLMAYNAQNDLEMAGNVLSELFELADLDDATSGLTEKDWYRIYTLLVSIKTQNALEVDAEERDVLIGHLMDSCESVLSRSADLPDCTRELAYFIVCASLTVLQNEWASRDQLGVILDAMEQIEQEPQVYPISPFQEASLYQTAALLALTLDDNRVERFFSEAIHLSRQNAQLLPLSVRTWISLSYAMYCARQGDLDTAAPYVSEALAYQEDNWKRFVKYLNDDRLMQILSPAQLQFDSTYALLRTLLDTEQLYEKVLQFKALASLAGRERNRIIYTFYADKDLLRQIQIKQDKLAALETEAVFREIDSEYQEEKAALRDLEIEFAKQFPDGKDFTEISWSRLQPTIPDNAVVVEYVYCILTFGKGQFDAEPADTSMGFDVFITQNRNGNTTLSRITITEGEKILAAADEFLDVLQAESCNRASLSQMEEKEGLRSLLYRKLVQPIIPYVDQFEMIYIAPDYGLVNLPFEILYDEDGKMLDDAHYVVKIECARDFLFQRSSQQPSAGSLIIGNPQYTVDSSALGDLEDPDENPKHSRGIRLDTRSVEPLPFSKVEAEKVGKWCRCRFYSGLDATKYLLMNADGYANIHIATHGYYDLSEESGEGMYSSCLLFAGSGNWLSDGSVSKQFGNGILTADEVSRLNLQSVNLVVLSSCLSGMNDVRINKGFHGMIGAFSAAGVRFVISHLWEANDFSSALLMDAFYYYYTEKGFSPQAALKSAKKYLRQASIGELRRNHWFDIAWREDADAKTKQLIAAYEQMDDRVRPFRSEAYWGGYACYQCY